MRKSTLLLALLALFMGGGSLMAQGISEEDAVKKMAISRASEIEEGTWYLMEQSRYGVSYLYSEDDGALKRKPAGTTVVSLASAVAGDHRSALVRFVKQDGAETYQIEMGTGRYFPQCIGGALTSVEGVANAGSYYINKVRKTDGSYTFQYGTTAQGGTQLDNNGAGNIVTGWGEAFKTTEDGTIGNNEWCLYKVTLGDASCYGVVSFTYSYKYNSKEVATQSIDEVIVGNPYPALSVAMPFGVEANAPAGFMTEGDNGQTKDIECTLKADFPFKFYASFDEIQTWYAARLHSNQTHYMYSDDSAIAFNDNSFVVGDEAYGWAFVGNPFDGFKFYNKKAGKDVMLDSNDPCTLSAGEYLVKVYASNTDVAGGFTLKFDGQNYLNYNGGRIVRYSVADAGSTWRLEELDFTGITDLTALLETAEQWSGAIGVGTSVGQVTAESAGALRLAIQNARAALEAHENCLPHIASVQAALDGLVTVQPSTDRYYRIVSAGTSSTRDNTIVYLQNNGEMHFEVEANNPGEASIGYAFQFQSADNGMFYLRNVEHGTYIANAPTWGGYIDAKADNTASAKPVAIANMGKANIVSITPQGGHMLHAQESGKVVVGWPDNNAESGSAWKIEEIEDIAALSHTLTFNETGWATLYLGYDTEIPAGVTAYAVSSQDASKAMLTEVEGVIPANYAVILNGAGTQEFKVSTTAAAAVPANKLEGTSIDTNVSAEAYVLSKIDGGKVGFYKVALNQEENTAFKNNAFKAYLPAGTNPSRFLTFGFDGTETGIGNIEGNEVANGVTYDLSGRRVKNAAKGIYIVNGKKVIK